MASKKKTQAIKKGVKMDASQSIMTQYFKKNKSKSKLIPTAQIRAKKIKTTQNQSIINKSRFITKPKQRQPPPEARNVVNYFAKPFETHKRNYLKIRPSKSRLPDYIICFARYAQNHGLKRDTAGIYLKYR